jgi:hypothetical protein
MQRDRALNHLKAIRREVGQLTALEPAWAALESDDRIGYRAEWENTLDRFAAVVRAYVDDRLEDDVAAELTDVAKVLVAFAPTLERMQLRQPSPDDLRRLGILSAA